MEKIDTHFTSFAHVWRELFDGVGGLDFAATPPIVRIDNGVKEDLQDEAS